MLTLIVKLVGEYQAAAMRPEPLASSKARGSVVELFQIQLELPLALTWTPLG